MTAEENEQSPFTRPGFVVAAVTVAMIVVLGIVLAVVNATGNDPESDAAPRSPSTTESPTAEPTAPAEGASVCGRAGVELTGDLPVAPAAVWKFQGTTAYPTSETFGPGQTTTDGVRFCFQHSPAGALFAAANAVAQGSDPAVQEAFARYFTAAGPGREAAIEAAVSDSPSSGRLEIVGFRLLEYGEGEARVDIAVRATSSGQTIYASGVYPLRWEAGDWKLMVSPTGEMLYDFAQIPDLAGYTSWGA